MKIEEPRNYFVAMNSIFVKIAFMQVLNTNNKHII